VRNIFDQYQQPENRLTHALATVLDRDRSLLVPFLKWLGVSDIPSSRQLKINEQQVPGLLQENAGAIEQKGLPDLAVFDDSSWAVLLESKVQAPAKLGQLNRHRETAKRHGYDDSWVIMISVGSLSWQIPEGEARMIARTWQEVYSWFNHRTTKSSWAKELVEYMQVFERKMLAQEYNIQGTITVFDGLRFDEDNLYTYREGKRLIRLLGDLLQKRPDLRKLSHDGKIGVDADGSRRPAITGKGTDSVWDFLPINVAHEAQNFTSFPHLTMGIGRSHATAAVTVPNGVKGGFRTKLKSIGLEGFMDIVSQLERDIRPIVQRSKGAKPMIYVTQRHYASQNSMAEVDGRLESDLRTACSSTKSKVRYQPEWVAAIYQLLTNKRSNIQFGVDVQFNYKCPVVQSREAVDLFAGTWKALFPLVDFVLEV
jgi:hypothetical protein